MCSAGPPAQAADAPSSVTAGTDATCVVLAPTGRVACWGDGAAGQLGDGTSTSSEAPVAVSEIAGAASASAGQDHACAVLGGGGVRCWGFAPASAFPSLPSSVTPVPVSGITSATAVTAGARHDCALVAGGGVRCWGQGTSGELGNGANSTSAQPVEVSGIASAVAIGAGAGHTCAVLSGGGVRCWGRGGHGELGDGASSDRATPVAVSGIGSAVAIGVGTDHACALLSSGSVECWGAGEHGQLGNGTTADSATPVAVSGLTGAIAISAGGRHSCAVLSSATIQCWGNGGDGELGNGVRTASATPVAVDGLDGVVAVSAGLTHTCALLAAGEVRCWGSGDHGELGDGAGESSLTPVTVAALLLPAPVFGETTTVQPVSGRVLVRRPGAKVSVPLRAEADLPLGTTFDTTAGSVRLTSATGAAGLTQSGVFHSGIFKTGQTTEPSPDAPGTNVSLTVLTLTGPRPTGCGARASAAAKSKRKRKRSLWGVAQGNFRTAGEYAAATVLGTKWLVQDSCAGTLVRVETGTVRVTDLVRNRTTKLSAPRSLLVRAASSRSFAVDVARLLSRLARGRKGLASALGGALRCSKTPGDARRAVEAVIANRTGIRDDLAGIATASRQESAVIARLRTAVEASIVADRHYRDWLADLEANQATCPLPRTGAFLAAARADRRANAAKRRLVAAFNPLARRKHLRTWRAKDL
jgi:alpha-tubulin suppressor-like RCC1 family protein